MTTTRLTGQEYLHRAGQQLDHRVLDFWSWADSELLSNGLRGRLAEYLVALDLGVADGIRTEWASFDLKTPGGVTVEVKSAAYLQAWPQSRPSKISFGIAPTFGWDEDTAQYDAEQKRQAHVYVFAVLGEPGQADVDPLVVRCAYYDFSEVPKGRLREASGCDGAKAHCDPRGSPSRGVDRIRDEMP